MRIVTDAITLGELREMAAGMFGNMVKAVVDIQRGIMAVDGELHADEEALLLQEGSRQEDLWGVNLYPDLPGAERVEFDSVINLRPSQGNRSRSVENQQTREHILAVVDKLVRP